MFYQFLMSYLFKCNCWPLKLVVVSCMVYRYGENGKLVAKSEIKAKQTEIIPEKGQTFTKLFMSHNNYFDKQKDGQTEKKKLRDLRLCIYRSYIFKIG